MNLSKNYVGQKNAWNTVRNAILPAYARGEGRFILMSGPAGVGKTHLAKEIHREMALVSDFSLVLFFDTGGELARVAPDKENPETALPIDHFAGALQLSAMGKQVFVFIDEAHELPKSGSAFTFLSPLFLGAGEGWKGAGTLLLRGQEIAFNRENITVILASNHKNKIMGGNTAALARRATDIVLDVYSDDEMRILMPLYMEAKGLIFSEGADANDKRAVKTQLLKVHRGTFEALDAFRNKVDSQNITRESAIEALRSIQWTLRGFTWLEIDALKVLKGAEIPLSKKSVVESIRGGTALDWQDFISYAKNQRVKLADKTLSPLPFITEKAGMYKITDAGKKFLSVNSAWLNREGDKE